MTVVAEIQTAIDRLIELKAESAPIRDDSSWVVDYDMPNLERTRVLVLESHNGGYDGAIVAEVTSDSRAQLIVTLHRTIDAQLAILNHTLAMLAPFAGMRLSDEAIELELTLARAINGGAR